jgi:DNA-binding NarL/FixJ family response regulator
LAIKPRVLRESVAAMLRREADIDVVGQVTDQVDLLLAVLETGADVVIHSADESQPMPAVYTHLLSEFPELRIIALSADAQQGFAYRQEITARPLPAVSPDEVLSAVRWAAESVEE